MPDHPLTNEIGQIIWKVANEKSGGGFTQEDLLRAAADWQLEQVIEFLEDCPDCYEMPRVIRELKKAMRPQEES